MRRFIFMCLLALGLLLLPARAACQGMPVYDNTNFITLGKQIIEAAKQTENLIKTVEFMKGNIPWITGMITMVIDLITGHGVGHWKRGKGTLDLSTNAHTYSIELVNYDREQTSMAVKRINNKLKTD